MPLTHDGTHRALALPLVLAGLLPLSGCFTDTSSMNVDRFRYETAPVWARPAVMLDENGNPVETLPPAATGYAPGPMPFPPGGAAFPHKPGIARVPVEPAGTVRTGLLTSDPALAGIYGPMTDDGRMLPAIPYQRIDPRYLRQEVAFPSADKPGTIIVDTKERLLYFVLGNGRAMRYGVGIGREGHGWTGRGVIQWRQRWPRWTPPDEMVARQPDVAIYSAANGGMNPGLNNPLGARALYIFKDGKDSLFRVHGTPEWQSIGKAVSSGCVRMLNQDVIDLFDRVPDKAEIIVL